MPNYVILVTGASSGFGQATAEALAKAGHTAYASMQETEGRNAAKVAQYADWAKANSADLRTVELDVQSDASVDAAVKRVMADAGRLDGVVHNAGHMVFGPLEAFTTEQLAEQYDVNVLGTHRLNRAALPHMRARRQGLLVWVGSSSTRGGTPPYLGPYFAAKAGMDSLAVTYAGELSRWNIETTIIVPGSFTTGTNHFANAGKPSDAARAAEYENGPYAGLADQALKGLAGLSPPDADPGEVAPDRPCHRPAVRQASLQGPHRPGGGRRRGGQRGRRPHAPGDVSRHRPGRPFVAAHGWLSGAGRCMRRQAAASLRKGPQPGPPGLPHRVRRHEDDRSG